MRLVVAFSVVSGLVISVRADTQKEVTNRVTATATSAMAKYPAWGAIGQETAELHGWCTDKADPVGESITFAFDDALPLDKLELVAGITPNWSQNDHAVYGLPERVEIKTDKQTVEATLERGEFAKNAVALSGAPTRSVTIKIVAAKKGKVAATCINSVRFSNAKIRYHNVYGMDAAALAAFPKFALALDAAFRSCDPTVLGRSITFPLPHEHEVTVGMGAEPVPRKEMKYKSVTELVAACKRDGSPLQLGIGGEVDTQDHDSATEIANPWSETNGQLRVGDWNTHAWWIAWIDGSWRLTHVLTGEDREHDQKDQIENLAHEQLDMADTSFTPDASLVIVQPKAGVVKAREAAALLGIAGAKHAESNVTVTMARDHRAAVLSFVVKASSKELRVSELVVRSDGYWKIAGGMWSEAKANDAVNKAAKDEKIGTFARVAPLNAPLPPLADAFFAMQKGAIDATAAARKDLVVFGSGPNERSVGGDKFARPWLAAWANHVPLDASGFASKLGPTGSTGWLATDIMLEKHDAAKKLYLIPFRVFLVFDKALDGSWTLLHAHLATVAP